MRKLFPVGVAVLFAALFTAHAQLGVGTITGRISDPSGAAVPGASVVVVNSDTNFRFTSQTNEEGIFRIPGLQPGPYRVSIEAEGFKTYIRDNLVLRVGATQPVDVALEVGAITEQVEVTAETPLLETETSAAGSVLEGEIMYRLPNYQRYAASTFNFVPGVTAGGYAYGGGLGNYHVAGQRASAIGAFEDGVNNNDQRNGTSYVKPVLNSVEEIKVIATNVPAEYGHSGGGVLDVVKKTGTNQFHGLASVYGRNRGMQHRLFFDKFRTSQPQPSSPTGTASMFLLPDFNVSGPIIRNKTFFLAGYQHLIEKKTAQAFGRVPTDAMKAGDFSFGGIGNKIYDPASTRREANGTWVRDQIPNNQIPLSQFDPVARKIIGLDPWVQPNQSGVNAEGPTDNLLYNENARVFFHDFNARIDHQFTPNVKIYGSWAFNYSEGLQRPPRNVRLLEFDASDGWIQPDRRTHITLGNTWIINPTMVLDMRAGYNRYALEREVPSVGQDWPGQLGIPNVPDTLMPSFGSTSGNQNRPDTTYGLHVTGPRRQVDETLSYRADLTKVQGTHSFKVGYEILRFRLNASQVDTPSGQFLFDNMTAGLQAGGQPVPNTGNTFAGFLLGYVRQGQFTQELAAWHPRSSINSFYFQDDWKFSPTVTINWGFRYTVENQFTTQYGQHSNFDPSATDALTGRKGAIVHTGERLAKTDWNNIQPRFGVAWRFRDRWVFRGGLGFNTIDIKYPLHRGYFEEYVGIDNQEQLPGDPRPVYRISEVPRAPSFRLQPDGSSPFTGRNFGSRTAEWWDPNLRNPYAVNWNAGVQRELGNHYLVELLYQGSGGVGLIERWNQNVFPIDFGANDPAVRQAAFNRPQDFRPYPHFGDVRLRCNCGHSSYHSGTVKLEKRMSEGLMFLTFYTWSKSLDSQDGDNDGGGVDPLRNRNLEKALAGYHREHRWIGTVTYELPFGPGKRFGSSASGIKRHLVEGWELSWVQTWESGNPVTFSYDGNPANQWPTYIASRRPNPAAEDIQLIDGYRENMRTSPDRFTLVGIAPIYALSDFSYPGAFTPGALGRNSVIGPDLVWTQISAAKRININERVYMYFRWDMQNAFHRYNFNVDANPTLLFNARTPDSFGKVRSDPRTASIGGQPLMNLTLSLHF
jgi:hypothetical protein